MRTFIISALSAVALLFISSSTFAANWVLDPGLSAVVFKYNYGSDEYALREGDTDSTQLAVPESAVYGMKFPDLAATIDKWAKETQRIGRSGPRC